MDQEPLVNERIEAGERFLAAFNGYAPVAAAFWLRDEGEWTLYIASDVITDENFDVAYGEVARLTSPRDPWLDPFQIRVANTDDDIVRGVREHIPGGVRLPGRVPGYSNELYVYRCPVATAGGVRM